MKKKKKARKSGGGGRGQQSSDRPVYSDGRKNRKYSGEYTNFPPKSLLLTEESESEHSSDDNLVTPPEVSPTAPQPSDNNDSEEIYQNDDEDHDPDQDRGEKRKFQYPNLPPRDWPDHDDVASSQSRPAPRPSSRKPGARVDKGADNGIGHSRARGSDRSPSRARPPPESRDPERDAREEARIRAEIHREQEIVDDLNMDILVNEKLTENLNDESNTQLDTRDVLLTRQELLNSRKDHRERIRHLSGQLDRQEFGPGPQLQSQAQPDQQRDPALLSLVTKSLGALQLLSEQIKDGQERMSGIENILSHFTTKTQEATLARDTQRSHMTPDTRPRDGDRMSRMSHGQGGTQRPGQSRQHGRGRQGGGGSPSSSSSSSTSPSSSAEKVG